MVENQQKALFDAILHKEKNKYNKGDRTDIIKNPIPKVTFLGGNIYILKTDTHYLQIAKLV